MNKIQHSIDGQARDVPNSIDSITGKALSFVDLQISKATNKFDTKGIQEDIKKVLVGVKNENGSIKT